MSDWEAENLRLTFFLGAPVLDASDGAKAWRKITGIDPERSIRDSRNLRAEESGVWNETWLTVQHLPGRVDVLMTPLPDEMLQEIPEGPRTIGRLDARRAALKEALDKLVDGWSSPITRVAFGTVLLLTVADRTDGYKRLGAYMKSVQVDPSSSDFMYQINRPRDVKLGDERIAINRLSKWSVALLARTQLVLQGNTFVVSGAPAPIAHACRLELDISTDAQRSALLPNEKLGELFAQLVNLGAEIAEVGDLP